MSAEKEKAEKEAAELQALRDKAKQMGAIHHVMNTDDSGVVHHAFFKSPSRIAVGVFLAEAESNVTAACEILFNDAVIKEISDVTYFSSNNEVFNGIIYELQRLIRVKKSISTAL